MIAHIKEIIFSLLIAYDKMDTTRVIIFSILISCIRNDNCCGYCSVLFSMVIGVSLPWCSGYSASAFCSVWLQSGPTRGSVQALSVQYGYRMVPPVVE